MTRKCHVGFGGRVRGLPAQAIGKGSVPLPVSTPSLRMDHLPCNQAFRIGSKGVIQAAWARLVRRPHLRETAGRWV